VEAVPELVPLQNGDVWEAPAAGRDAWGFG